MCYSSVFSLHITSWFVSDFHDVKICLHYSFPSFLIGMIPGYFMPYSLDWPLWSFLVETFSTDFAFWSLQISLLKNRVNIASGTPSRLVILNPFY